MYASNGIGLVEAFHPGTGDTVWVQDTFAEAGSEALRSSSSRGVAYWTHGADERLFVVQGEYLIALDIRTGRPVENFGEGGRVNLRVGLGPRYARYSWTGVPQVCRDVVIVANAGMADAPRRAEQAPGNVQAFDVRTGVPRWTFEVIPRPGQVGVETWLDDSWEHSGAANLWALMSADEELGYAYLPLTSPTNDVDGGPRGGHRGTRLCGPDRGGACESLITDATSGA